MSSISAINSVTKKYFLPIEIENIIFEYLKLEDYNKARAKFNKNFLNRMSLNHPSLTLFNGILGDIINIKEQLLGKFSVMRYIYKKSDRYLNREIKFYDLYDYDNITACGMDFYSIEGGYVPKCDDDIEGYDNIEILAETFRIFRCKYACYGRSDDDFFKLYFKYNDVVYKNKILEN